MLYLFDFVYVRLSLLASFVRPFRCCCYFGHISLTLLIPALSYSALQPFPFHFTVTPTVLSTNASNNFIVVILLLHFSFAFSFLFFCLSSSLQQFYQSNHDEWKSFHPSNVSTEVTHYRELEPFSTQRL